MAKQSRTEFIYIGRLDARYRTSWAARFYKVRHI